MSGTKRRSFSVRGPLFERLQVHARNEGMLLTHMAEAIITEALDAAGVPQVTVVEAESRRDKNVVEPRIVELLATETSRQWSAMEIARGVGYDVKRVKSALRRLAHKGRVLMLGPSVYQYGTAPSGPHVPVEYHGDARGGGVNLF